MTSSSPELVAFGVAHPELLDEDGRPLGEVSAAAYETCPRHEEQRRFRDARGEGLVNLAALAQIHQGWSSLLETLRGWESESAATAGRALRRAHRATFRARWRAARGRPIRREDAALFKLCLGFGHLLRAKLLDETLDADAPLPGAPDLWRWLDEGRWLIGDQQVCAGSRTQIERTWEALTGSGTPPADDEEERLAAGAMIELESLAGVAACVARALVRSPADEARSRAARLAFAPKVPRLVEDLRQAHAAGASPLAAALLFESERVPASLRAMFERLVEVRDAEDGLEALDRVVLEVMAEPAARLFARAGAPSAGVLLDVFVAG